MTDAPENLAAWLKRNPEPDVRELIERSAWKDFERKRDLWKRAYRRHQKGEKPQ
jgi:hypothetical protein